MVKKGNRRRNFYTKQLAQLEEELAAVEADIETASTASARRKREKEAENILVKIEEIEEKLIDP